MPSIDDLVKYTGYILPENRDHIYKDEYVKESDLEVTISGEVDGDIVIKVASKKGRCFKGDAFILVINKNGSKSEWINYDNKS